MPPEEFPHDCHAFQIMIGWIHEKVKIKDGEAPSNSHEVEGGNSTSKADAYNIEGEKEALQSLN